MLLILFAGDCILKKLAAISYRRIVLLYNPEAGKLVRGGSALLDEAHAALVASGRAVDLRPTTGPRTATAMAKQAVTDGADLVIAAGGDGTINEVAEGMIGSSVPLAILPAGTANVLAMETGLGSNLLAAAAKLNEWVPCRISAGRLTASGSASRHFLLMAGAGLDAHIVYHLDAALKSKTGKFAYWVGGFKIVGRDLPEFVVSVEGVRHTCSFALISRVRNYGGDLQIACNTSLLDDCFEIVLFEGTSSYRYLKYFAGVATRRLAGMRGVKVMRAAAVDLSCPGDSRIYVQIDGEFAGRLPARVELASEAITVLLPPAYVSSRGRRQEPNRILAHQQ